MPCRKILLFVLWIGLLASTPASASFRIKKVTEVHSLLSSLPQASPASSVVPTVDKDLTFVQKMKQAFLVRKLMKETMGKGGSRGGAMSIASICLSAGGYLLGAIGLAAGVSTGGAGFLAVMLLGFLAMIGGFVAGIMALATGSKLKGLAIAGVVIGGIAVLYTVLGIIILAAYI